MFLVKLKAGALQLTLFITVIIALLLIAFILLVHTHKRFSIQTGFIIETIRNTDKGFDFALQNSIRLKDTTIIQLNEETYKSLKVHRDFWGIFEKVTLVSNIKNNRFEKTALIGAKQPEGRRTGLYVKDNNKPLILVGNTKIEGVAYLPRRGVKSGTISGQSYYGSQLIYGQTRVSSNLPKLPIETVSQIKSIENDFSRIENRQFLTIENDKQYNNSFLNLTQAVFSNSDIHLNSVELIGNILIQSKSKIVVEASSILKDVVLIAPEIEIKSNVNGSFQAIASKKITVGKSVQLQYPSALILNDKQEVLKQQTTNQSVDQNGISIGDNSTIKGVVLYLGQENLNNYKIQIELKAKAMIIGELYCNQNIELKGTVYGTVYSNDFIANQFGSVYQNHIYNGTINVNELSQEYVGLPFNNSKKSILKWLY